MIHFAAHKTPPHLFPIGHRRTIQGEPCVLQSYTPGRNPHPRYRKPDGSTITIRPATNKSRRERT